MRSRVGSAHAEALARRLEQLRAELDGEGSTSGAALTPYDDGWEEHTRIRPVAAPEDGVVEQPDTAGVPELGGVTGRMQQATEGGRREAPLIPEPGRHAARRERPRPAWLDLSALRGRVELQPAHVALAAVLAAVALGVTCWWVLADDAGEPVAAAEAPVGLVTPAVDAPSASGAGADTTDVPPNEVVVDVAGKVREPGIVVLDTGSRVVDALEAAGGAKRGVDLTNLNLARVLVDGEQIVVGQSGPSGLAASAAPSGAPEGSGALVNLNSAGVAELDELPGVGPVTAQAIIDWRDTNGGFRSVDQLLDVQGIGEKTLADLAPLVTL